MSADDHIPDTPEIREYMILQASKNVPDLSMKDTQELREEREVCEETIQELDAMYDKMIAENWETSLIRMAITSQVVKRRAITEELKKRGECAGKPTLETLCDTLDEMHEKYENPLFKEE